MKLIDILLEVLTEGKQVGILYHFTDYGSALDIIKNGFVLKKTGEKNSSEDFISLTRNKNLYSPTVSGEVRFTIDGDGLSDRYKIQPFADTASGFGRGKNLRDESEERVNANLIGGELNFSKYLKSIDVMDISPDNNVRFNRAMVRRNQSNLINYLEDNNIQFNIVDSYKYTNNKKWQKQHPRKSP
jgi:hypothetical protein